MSDFYTDTIVRDPRFRSTDLVSDPLLLEPVMRASVMSLIADAHGQGVEFMIFETYRSQERQLQLFNQGKSQLKNVGVHHFGLACDIVKNKNGRPSWDGDFSLLGKLGKKYGLIWGGDWGTPGVHHSFLDLDHVQRCAVGDQPGLFALTWYPDENYNPYTGLPEALVSFSTKTTKQLIADKVPEKKTLKKKAAKKAPVQKAQKNKRVKAATKKIQKPVKKKAAKAPTALVIKKKAKEKQVKKQKPTASKKKIVKKKSGKKK
jgi:hypothetical protein